MNKIYLTLNFNVRNSNMYPIRGSIIIHPILGISTQISILSNILEKSLKQK